MASGAEGSARGRRLLRLSPQDRLRKRFEFGRARDQGRRVHTRSFVLLIRPNQLDRTRLGLTVSHKVGNAVRRNRIKRLVREVFRQQRELFPEASDVVVIAKAGRTPDGFEQVRSELGRGRSALRAARDACTAGRGPTAPAQHGPRSGRKPGRGPR